MKKYLPYFLGILILGFLIKLSLSNGDFKVYLEAAKLIASGKSPYHEWLKVDDNGYCLYFYSPLWALILIPFIKLPNAIPNLLWLLANIWFVYRLVILLSGYLNLKVLSDKQIKWLYFLVSVSSLRFLLYNFEMMQMTIFILWGALESLSLFKKNKFLPGGSLLALVINIKILPIVLLPYLIYRREYKGVLTCLVFAFLFLLLPAVFLGWSFNFQLLHDWWNAINPTNAEHLYDADPGFHDLTALIPSLLTKTESALPNRRNILDLNFSTAIYIMNGLRGCLVLLTLYFLKWPPFQQAKSKLNELRELSFLFLIVPLIFPHQGKYAFFLCLPALVYISYFLVQKRANVISVLFVCSFVLMTLTSDGLIGRELNLLTQHYKLITYGALLLILILILLPAESIEKKVDKNIG